MSLEPRAQTGAYIVHQFKLQRFSGLSPENNGATMDVAADDQITDLDVDDITSAPLAVDSQIK